MATEKTTTVSVRVPVGFVAKLDNLARRMSITRSEFVAWLLGRLVSHPGLADELEALHSEIEERLIRNIM
jgi:predicted transcriptional regulator